MKNEQPAVVKKGIKGRFSIILYGTRVFTGSEGTVTTLASDINTAIRLDNEQKERIAYESFKKEQQSNNEMLEKLIPHKRYGYTIVKARERKLMGLPTPPKNLLISENSDRPKEKQ